MKLTGNQLKKIIMEARRLRALNEEQSDCERDYRLGALTWEEYQDCLKQHTDPHDKAGDDDHFRSFYDKIRDPEYMRRNPDFGSALGRGGRRRRRW